LSWNFSLHRNIFYNSGFLSNSRLHGKTELPWNFSLDWNSFLSSRIFEQLALALKTELALKFFKPGGAAPSPPRVPMLLPLFFQKGGNGGEANFSSQYHRQFHG